MACPCFPLPTRGKNHRNPPRCVGPSNSGYTITWTYSSRSSSTPIYAECAGYVDNCLSSSVSGDRRIPRLPSDDPTAPGRRVVRTDPGPDGETLHPRPRNDRRPGRTPSTLRGGGSGFGDRETGLRDRVSFLLLGGESKPGPETTNTLEPS